MNGEAEQERGDAPVASRRVADRPAGNSSWLIPSLGFTLLLGSLGVTAKLALADVDWTGLFIWQSIAFMLAALALATIEGVRFAPASGTTLGLISGTLAALALIALSAALVHADASKVIPVTSAYPVVTMLLAVPVLAERVTLRRVAACLLVVSGVILISI